MVLVVTMRVYSAKYSLICSLRRHYYDKETENEQNKKQRIYENLTPTKVHLDEIKPGALEQPQLKTTSNRFSEK